MRDCTHLILGLLVMALVAGCSETTTGPETTTPDPGGTGAEAPALPALDTMLPDFSFFDGPAAEGSLALEADPNCETCSHRNWFNAVLRVAVIDLVVAAGMTPPTVAFAAAVQTHPSYLGDLTWLWIYTWIDAEGRELQVRLRGQLIAQAVAWEMRVTSEATTPPFDEALWFHGQSPIGYGEGFWIIRDITMNPAVEVFRIDFASFADEDEELRFENIDAGDEDYGDTLTYRVVGSLCRMEFYDASENAYATVRWDEATGTGSLQCPDFNGGELACWDEEQCDGDCPSEPL